MSQKNIDFMKKNNYQLKKQNPEVLDTVAVNLTQKLLSGQIDSGDTVVDVDMPTKMLTTNLNWYDGGTNDNIVKITKNGIVARKNITDDIIEQIIDLTGDYPIGLEYDISEPFTSIVIYDNKLIVGNETGYIIYYDFETELWTTDGSGPSNLFTALGTSYPVYCMIEYQGNLIVGSSSGRLACYNGGIWNNYDRGGTFCSNGTIIGSSSIYTMIEYNGHLIVAGANGHVASYDGTNWKNYDGTGIGFGIYNEDTYLTYHIFHSIIYNDILVFAGSDGHVASYDGTNWKGNSGTGTGTGPFGTSVVEALITAVAVYNDTLIFASDTGQVSSYDGTNWKYFDGTGTGTGIFRQFSGEYSIRKIIEYDDKLFFFHEALTSEQGKVDSWDSSEWVENDNSYFGDYTFFSGIEGDYTLDSSSQIKNALLHNEVIYLVSQDNRVESYKKEDGVSSIYLGNPSTTDFINTEIPDLTLGGYSGGNRVRSIIEYGDYYVFSGERSEVSSYHKTNLTWHTPNSNNGGIVNDGLSIRGSSGGGIVYTMVEFDGDLILAGSSGRISSFDGTNWKYHDGSGTGTSPYNSGAALGGDIYCSIDYDTGSSVVFAGFQGRITTWNGTAWKNYDGTWDGPEGGSESWCNDGTAMGNGDIKSIANVNSVYVFGGMDGKIANFDGVGFTNYDGTGNSTQPFNDGSLLGIMEVGNIIKLNTAEFFVTDVFSQAVASWNVSGNWVNADGTGTGSINIHNNGEDLLGSGISISFACEYNGGSLIAGESMGGEIAGRVASCNAAGVWTEYDGDGGSTIYNNETVTSEEITAGLLTSSGNLIFASETAEVGSYDGSWRNYDTSGTGVYNTNISPFGFYHLSSSVIYDNKLIIGNRNGEISYYDLVTKEWIAYDSGTGPSNDGTAMGNFRIYSMIVYKGNLIIAGDSGRVVSYDGTNWKNYDGSGSGTGIYNDSTVLGTSTITHMAILGNYLVLAGGTRVGSYWVSAGWKNYDGGLTGTGPFDNASSGIDDDIGGMIVYNDNLVLGGDAGKISSYDGTNWKKYDGTLSGTGPYSNGTGVTDPIEGFEIYQGYLVVMSSMGRIGSCDINNNWTKYDGTGDDPTAYLYSNTGSIFSMSAGGDYMVKADASSPVFSFYQDKNNSFLSGTYYRSL